MRVALLGGQFAPPTVGHLALARAARDQLDAEVWWVVCAHPPHREVPVFDYHTRVAMVNVSLDGEERMKVSTLEATLPAPSRTVHTLRRMRDLWPEHEFWWVIGADEAQVFDDWYAPEEIRSLVRVAVAGRGGHAQVGSLMLAGRPADAVLDMVEVPVSSSFVRGLLSLSEPVIGLVPDHVNALLARMPLPELRAPRTRRSR